MPKIKTVRAFGPDPLARGNHDSYYFSRWFHCWGWGTWRRAWLEADHAMTRWDPARDGAAMRAQLPSSTDAAWFIQQFSAVEQDELDSWAFPCLLSWWRDGGLHAHIRRNLVSNIGFGTDAVHTTDASSRHAVMATFALDGDVVHPVWQVANAAADLATLRETFVPSRAQRFQARVERFVKRRLQR